MYLSSHHRCLICCKGFPTSYHHKHHHLTTHSDESYTPAMLVGFSSNELRQLWGTQDYAKMVLADWSVNMAAPMRGIQVVHLFAGGGACVAMWKVGHMLTRPAQRMHTSIYNINNVD